MKAIQHEISGLKCDTPSCDYRDDSIKADNYERYINEPCPKCGESLLTQADYDIVQKYLAIAESLNKVFGEVADDSPVVRVSLGLDGTGKVNPKIVEGE